MIEVLILYTIRKREKTIYSIRKEIFEIFGVYTKPSIGTIHPALKRLLKSGAVSLNERMSNGGKKSSYYSITPKGIEAFQELFFETSSDNPSLFYTQLFTRIGALDFLPVEARKLFIKESIRKIKLIQYESEEKLKDEFLELTSFQRQILEKTKLSMSSLESFIEQIKVEDDG